MSPTNWPDPKRPGVPMFPEQDGWHWLRVFGRATIEWWSADKQAFDNHYDPDYAIYECACLTHTQINEMLAAERERCAKLVKQEVTSLVGDKRQFLKKAHLRLVLKSIIQEIRNLGAAT